MSKRYGMVFDLNTCMGCQACVAACSMENETPYWEGKYRTRVEEVVKESYPQVERHFVPQLCMHCDNAPCVDVCPTGASFTNENGVVMVDYEKCIGCQACVAACPYGARYDYDTTALSEAVKRFGSDLEHVRPHVDKCNFCPDRLAEGLEPACVATCPGEARIFGDWNDPGSKVNQALARAGDRGVRIAGTAIGYILPATMPVNQGRPLAPADSEQPDWVKGWKGLAHPAAKAVLGTAVGVLGVATVANYAQKKKEENHDEEDA